MSTDGAYPGAPEEYPTILYVGHHESRRESSVTVNTLNEAQASGYDLVTAPLTTEYFQLRVLAQLKEYVNEINASSNPATVPLPLISPLMPDDTDRKPDEINPSIFGIISPWIDLASPDPLISNVSKQILNLEVAYAAFCGISNLIIHEPGPSGDVVQYSRAIAEGLSLGTRVHFHVLLPMTASLEEAEAFETSLSELCRDQYSGETILDDDEPLDQYASWERWNTMRTLCSYSHKLSVALELPRQTPQDSLRSRWYSEPIRVVLIPRTSFIRNEKSYPVLSKNNQLFLSRLMRLRYVPLVLLGDVGPIPSLGYHGEYAFNGPTPSEAAAMDKERPTDPLAHLRYMRHLQQVQPPRPIMERFGQGYQDYMQSPLQPLTDNLESNTYEVFEKDPVKYEWYERAIASALRDLRGKVSGDRKLVVAVVGAGRGPLVTRALQASQSTGISIHCCAVEKNPNAHVVIQQRNLTDPLWNRRVLIYKSDMRAWPGPTIDGEIHKVDILVSELLGSFADNELSPECLDGVQHVLEPNHGVNIPQSYSAHVSPIATPKLYGELQGRMGGDFSELPYVVLLHQFDFLCLHDPTEEDPPTPQVKEAWSFSHPAPDSILQQSRLRSGGTSDGGGWTGGDGKNEHNVRSCILKFRSRDRGVCHGLAGYFETVLYSGSEGPIELSTNPVTMEAKSKDMISWFPIFFPLKTPLYVPDDSTIEVTMWRQTDDRKVWYEWFVEVFKSIGHAKVRLGVSGLHSSRKDGCLM